MRIKFWGVRGSIPSPSQTTDLRDKINRILEAACGRTLDGPERRAAFLADLPPYLTCAAGANTPCVEVLSREAHLILDAGSGLRPLGLRLGGRRPSLEDDPDLSFESDRALGDFMAEASPAGELNLTLLISHTHWDHIQGFPFFAPAYAPGNRLTLYGQDGRWLRQALSLQQKSPRLFPIPLKSLASKIVCRDFPADGLELGDMTITAFPLPHPGGSLAFRLTQGSRSMLYATDYEFSTDDDEYAARFVDFARGVDLFISDTQYTYMESVAREGWGHCSSYAALDLALRAGARAFFLFHHDPEHSDAKLFENLGKTRAYYKMLDRRGGMPIELAVEGLTVRI